jgi:hypothetical protein
MIRPDNPGKGNNITRFVQVSEFPNQNAGAVAEDEGI